MGVLLNGHLPRVFLALKKHLSFSLEPSQSSYLAGISLELHLVAAWPDKPYRTGCEAPLSKIISFKRDRKLYETFSQQHSACSVLRCMHMTHTCNGQVLCRSPIGNLLSVRQELYVNEGVWACRNAPPKFKM